MMRHHNICHNKCRLVPTSTRRVSVVVDVHLSDVHHVENQNPSSQTPDNSSAETRIVKLEMAQDHRPVWGSS
jgi:hypothetical protein